MKMKVKVKVHLSNALDRMVTDQTLGWLGTLIGARMVARGFARCGRARCWQASHGANRSFHIYAVQEQLGLRLEATKASLGALIIDSVEQPSAN